MQAGPERAAPPRPQVLPPGGVEVATDDAWNACETLPVDFRSLVELPRGEMLQEWLAFSINSFFKYSAAMFSIFADECTDESCPAMTVGRDTEYLWVDIEVSAGQAGEGSDPDGVVNYRVSEPRVLPAHQYILLMLDWVRSTLQDPAIFPVDPSDRFPEDFVPTCQRILRRLVRIFEHAYHMHFGLFQKVGCVTHVNTCCRYMVEFGRRFELLTDEDLEPIEDLVRYWEYRYPSE